MRSQHKFSQVPSANIPRSSFNLSHPHKTTFDADYLVPIAQPVDIIPGDTFKWKTHFYMRLATPIAPILDNLYFESFAFFVPYRTIHDDFPKLHGAQDDPGDSIDFTVPTYTSTTTIPIGSVGDYFGLPTGLSNALVGVSAMPHRAYVKIFNEWFRDQNLQTSEALSTGAGPDGATPIVSAPLKRGKRADYFTSSLPWPQKGTAVSLPLGTTAPIYAEAVGTGTLEVLLTDGSGGVTRDLDIGASGNVEMDATASNGHELLADLSSATAATINDIRLAFQTQRLLERDARAGTRYVEILKSHWNVVSPDFRLQRSEFLGGGRSVVNITPVAQTSGQPTPAENDKLGNLAAYGTATGTHSWNKSFVEHGVVIIIGNLRGDITYSQGIDRYWTKSTRYDFYYPVLSGIGEQSVLNKEIYFQGASADDDVFGYQERYAEYRYLTGKLTSLMRPTATGSLESWHLSEEFTSLPTLGATFIESNTSAPLDRAIAIPSEPHMIADFYHEVRAARPLPLFGIPGNLDRL